MQIRKPHPFTTPLLALAAVAAITAATADTASAAEQKLRLTPAMLFNETAIGDPAGLVDEQQAVGDPASGKGQPASRPFFPGWGAWQYPVHIMIDLGARHRISRLFFYNETGQAEITVSSGKPFAWMPKPITISGYRAWAEIPFSVETRYIRLSLSKPVSLQELVVYGEPLEKSAPSPKPTRRPKRLLPTIDQMIGLNAFIDDPKDKITMPAGLVREYHSWSWDMEGKDGKRRFQPSGAAGGNSWFFDDYYAALKQQGVTVCPAIQMGMPSLVGTADVNSKPIPPGADPEAPASYALHAAHLFQFAARYGSRKVEDSLLDLAPGQPRRSGLGLLRYIENWNEPDRSWNGREGRFHPYELAAMCSADYDGNQGKMGKTVGVKNADPSLRLVMGGLAGLDLNYLKAMKLWADYNRKGDFPANVLNLHHYSSTGNEQGFKPDGKGISPEEDHLREKMAAITAWRDANLPDREVWLTEFGYDTNPGSPIHAPVIGSMNAEQVQAAWLVRASLALAAAGVDRTAMFMLRDVDSKAGGVFATCGLVTEKGKWEPKPSWYYFVTLKKRLAGMRFGAEIPTGRKDVLVYRFDAATGKRSAYAVWCPTSEDRRVTNFRLPVTAAKAATVVTFAHGQNAGVATPARVNGGAITLTVSETPVLVFPR